MLLWLLLFVWDVVIYPSWISLISAFCVLKGYRHLGKQERVGWIYNIASNSGLLIVGIIHQQWGLLVTLLLIRKAYMNWRQWGKASSELTALKAELANKDKSIRDLQAQRDAAVQALKKRYGGRSGRRKLGSALRLKAA